MKNLFCCIIYLTIIGFGSFCAGRLVPQKFCCLQFPYRPFQFEQNGKLYDKIGIRKWQNKLPNMSKLCPGLMPAKELPRHPTESNVEKMLQETCIAELTHFILCILGAGCIFLWKGSGGKFLSVLYSLGNLPFILIQRYNRPRLLRLLERQLKNLKSKEINANEKNTYIKLQYRART